MAFGDITYAVKRGDVVAFIACAKTAAAEGRGTKIVIDGRSTKSMLSARTVSAMIDVLLRAPIMSASAPNLIQLQSFLDHPGADMPDGIAHDVVDAFYASVATQVQAHLSSGGLTQSGFAQKAWVETARFFAASLTGEGQTGAGAIRLSYAFGRGVNNTLAELLQWEMTDHAASIVASLDPQGLIASKLDAAFRPAF